MSTLAQTLFNDLAAGLWSVLERYRAQAAGVLAALGPEPGFGGTVLDGRLLGKLRADAVAPGDPAVAALVKGLLALLPDPGAAGVSVALHGFDPGAGQPRGLALVFVTPPPAATVVAALTGAGPTGLAFEIAAVGAGAFGPATLNLLGNWSLQAGGNVGGGGRLQFPRGGPAQVLDGLPAISLNLTLQRNAAGGPVVLGPADGPHVSVGLLSAGLGSGVDAGGAPKLSYTLGLPDAHLSLASGVLSILLGDALDVPVDLELAADPELGLSFKGGGVRATVPANVDLPGINIRALEIAVSDSGGGLEFDFGLGLTGGLPGIPITLTVDGLGAAFPLATGGASLGIDPGAVRPLPPNGIGLDLNLPIVSGGGFLETTGPGGYGGVLDFNLIELSVAAFGLLQLPVNGQPFSFVAIMSVEFPLPGIQLGFGFSLNAVGGIVAINRRLDVPSLYDAIIDGSAGYLLFPVDPASHGPAIVATLGRIFPAADGHVVVGPVLQIGWGGRILTMTLAVVIDLPNPVQLVILGRLKVALPDPAAPLILLQAKLSGAFVFSPVPSVSLQASLDGSYIAGIALHGDAFFLLRSGDDAEFVLSVGGFHPRYTPPKGVPAHMTRIQADITPPGFPGMRAETYFAVTSNTVQFGVHVELCDEIAGCGVDGWFYLDALFRWDPVFSFSARFGAGVAVQVLGETLMGINFDLTLEGPSPWHVHGTGSVDLFLFSATLDFDVSWGDQPPALPPPPDLGPVFAAALTQPAAWVGAPSTDDQPMVTLSADARKSLDSGHSVHPLGRVTVRERAVPLDIQISRYQNRPITPQKWTISGAGLAPGIPAAVGNPTQDTFPPGEFLTLSEDQKLTRPAFEKFNSGVVLSPVDVEHPDLRTVDTSFEVRLIPDISILVPLNLVLVASAAEALLAVTDVHAINSLWNPPNLQTVSVLQAQPVALATTLAMKQQAVAGAPQGYTATLQAAQAQFGSIGPAAAVQLVEQWEVVA